MTSIEWMRWAEADLLRFQEFLIDKDIDAASAALVIIRDAVNRLRDHPKLGRTNRFDARYRDLTVRFGRNGYVVRYRLAVIEGRTVVRITRIWHSREQRN